MPQRQRRNVEIRHYAFLVIALVSYGCYSRLDNGDDSWKERAKLSEEKVRRDGGFVPNSGPIELHIHNRYRADIYISNQSWDSFGLCCPIRGIVPAGTGGAFECKWLEITPAETTVFWIDRSNGQEFSQSLDLTRLAQHRFISKVHFELTPNSKWVVWYDDEEQSGMK